MNPYDFVRVDWTHQPARHRPKPHDRFDGLSGRISGTLTTLTPLFLPAKGPTGLPLVDMNGATQFSQSQAYVTADNPKGYFIAGSSLKGLVRSLVETVAQGCFWFFDGKYKSRKDGQEIHSDYLAKIPTPFKRCSDPDHLCPACRLFGLIEGDVHRLGNVGFGDAVCTDVRPHDAIFTAALDNPKPRHESWYLQSNRIAGRKFYFHSGELLTEREMKKTRRGVALNAYIHPLGAGATFSFAADFTNVAEDDLSALLYAVILEETVHHKFGYAKPCGLGSIQVQLTSLTLGNPLEHYQGGKGAEVFEGESLTAELGRRTTPFARSISAITLEDLRRIWRWPPMPGVTFRYPTQGQFADHTHDPISSTDTW
jgi:CRISPR/Cas system CSM-associated protein Csm3 (group 7 of RAMP superfamily)